MEVDRDMIYPEFECYKLSLEEKFIIDYLPLNSKCKGNETDGNVEFQVLADDIYENKLKRSGDKFYYLNEQFDLVCVSLEKSSIISGPFECFSVSKNHDIVICIKNGNLVIIKNGENLTEPFELKNVKILEVKVIGSSIHLILQKFSKVKDMRNGENFSKLLEKTAFCFYSVVIDEGGLKYDLIGWSLSRPLVNFIRDGGEIILGTSTGIITDGKCNISNPEEFDTLPETVHEEGSGNEDEDEDGSYVCRMIEFKNNSIVFQYPEIRISGSAVNYLQVAAKHLDDVVIYDLVSTGQTKHMKTFPALNFIQSGKIDKKFSVFGKRFAFIIETSGNVYCYTKPVDKSQQTSSQYLVQLDEEVYGWAHEIEGERENDEILIILTKEKIYKLKIN